MHSAVVSRSATASAVAHLSAAQAYGMWLPQLPSWLPDLVVIPPGSRRLERSGSYAFRSRAALVETRILGDRRVVSPAVCLGQLAEDLRVLDLVIAIDGALQNKLCTMEEITAATGRRQRGSRPCDRRSPCATAEASRHGRRLCGYSW